MKRPRLYINPKFFTLIAMFLALPFAVLADAPKRSMLDNPMAIVLLSIIAVLMVVIGFLGYIVSGAAQLYMKRNARDKEEKKNASIKTGITILLLISGISTFAQDVQEIAAPKDHSVAGIPEAVFLTLMSVIGLEFIVIMSLAYFLRRFLKEEEAAAVGVPIEENSKEKINLWKKWWARANSFRSIREEADIDMGHAYDGIRELDNRLPPWWLYGFYCTILFAVIYLWRFEVSHTAPSSLQEYNAAVTQAEQEQEQYLAKAAYKVDENTVMMSDAAGIAAGKTIFTGTCAPCHGPDGGGVVGPNLTDAYWLHGGGLKDIFKTIKYGVQEKGMKSWKDDFSPVQLAQLASYVKSIQGTRPANAKEPQGDKYEEKATTDSIPKTASANQ